MIENMSIVSAKKTGGSHIILPIEVSVVLNLCVGIQHCTSVGKVPLHII